MSRPRIAGRVAILAAVAAVLTLSGVANAGTSVPLDQTSGSIGHYKIYDSYDSTGVTCWYSVSGSTNKVYEIDVKAPKVFWPDQSSSNHNEHGKIGFAVWLQQASMPTDPNSWHTIYKTPIQKATAYESTKANLSHGTITWHSSQNVYFRVIVSLTWYKSFGDTNGRLKHWDSYYTLAGSYSSGTPSVGNCTNKIPLQ